MTPDDWRYPGERPMLVGTLVVIGIILAVLVPFTLGAILFAAAATLALALFRVYLFGYQVRRRGRPADQIPRLAPLVEACRARLGLDPGDIQVYVIESDARNAFAIGVRRPFAVAVYTGLLDALDDDELAYVIGHELGHVRFRHTRSLALVGHLGQAGSGIFGAALQRVVFLGWSRTAEYSADRAGLVACGQLHAALSALLKVGLPPARLHGADVGALVRAVEARFREEDVGFAASARALARTHPMLEQRLDHLVDFAHSELGRAAVTRAQPLAG